VVVETAGVRNLTREALERSPVAWLAAGLYGPAAMRRCSVVVSILVTVLALAACQRTGDKGKDKDGSRSGLSLTTGSGAGSATPPARAKVEQITPPLDLKNPPLDAVKTSSGLIYKKLVANGGGVAAKRNDTVLINYTGWRQSNGETFFSNRSKGQPMPLPLGNTAPGFTEAMQLVKKGETAMLWVPPSIGYKGPPQGTPETLVYEVEVIDVVPAPAIPENVGAPPATAETLKSGTKFVTVRPGTGKDKARYFDTVTFNYTAWDAEGRMFDSTEVRKRPATVSPYRQTPVMEEVMTSMTAGQRLRFWVSSERMQQGGRGLPGMPSGQLCYEVEVLQIAKGNEPPAAPPDVASPPPGAKKTALGVSYKVLKQGNGGPHPKASSDIKVNYTGWTTDGRVFDSSVIKGEPGNFNLARVMTGWTDGIQVMSVGDKVRFWIPAEQAYKGAPAKPQGMLVFDVELLEVKDGAAPVEGAPSAAAPSGHVPAPPDANKRPKINPGPS
jgi:FKBP-type peptidyl-prolyl cis-trans isomerase